MKFNDWSKQRIAIGRKRLTSRKKQYDNDPDIDYIVGPFPWKFIRDFLWWDEGAYNNLELQRVVNGIFRREVLDDEQFYVHVLAESVYEKVGL